jgi:serine protease Do
MNAVDQIKTTGHVSRGMIGVQIQNVGRDDAKALGLPRIGGALVNKVTPGSTADKAGVQVGDVIVSFNGRDIATSADLPPLVGSTKPGTKTNLEIYRDGKNMTLPVTIGELPVEKATMASLGNNEPAAPPNALGLVVEDLTADQRKQLSLDPNEGVVVTRVNGPAARRAALEPGDVILMVGRRPVKNVGEFNGAIKDAKPGDSVMLLVRREDATSFIAVPIPKKG